MHANNKLNTMDKVKKSIDSIKLYHIKAIAARNKASQDQYNSFQSKYVALHETFSKLLTTSDALSDQLAITNELNTKLTQDKRMLTRENQELTMKCNDFNSTVQNLEKQSETFRNSLSSEHEQNEKLTNELDITQATINHKNAEIAEKDRLFVETQHKLTEIETEHMLLNNKYTKLNKEYIDKERICNTQISLLVNKLNEIDSEKYESFQNDIDNLQNSSNQESLKNIDLQKNMAQTRKALAESIREHAMAKSQVSSLLLRIEDLQSGGDKSKSILKRAVHFEL